MNKKEIIFPFHLINRKAVDLSFLIRDNISRPLFIEKDNRRANAKSLLGLLSLGLREGQSANIISDNDEDIKKVEQIIKNLKEEL
jgi:phosphotransferase system HPr-like phosphotransfer protein